MNFLKIIFQIAFNYPATIMHEMAHALFAVIIGGSFRNLTFAPSMEDGYLEYGSVIVAHRYSGLLFIPLLAPVVWWVALWYIAITYGFLHVVNAQGVLTIEANFPHAESLNDMLLHAYGAIQMLVAGKPSSVDVRGAVDSVLTFEGSVLFGLLLVISTNVLLGA